MEAKRDVYLNRLIQKKNNPYIKIIGLTSNLVTLL